MVVISPKKYAFQNDYKFKSIISEHELKDKFKSIASDTELKSNNHSRELSP